ncbi:hypothetical protein PTE_01728 [Photorhabdus khanii NC19]|uniref:Uncharacterized protein n=1 Tax=Photorhabdus khanii NC19 TaxID=1004151 RepID=W3V808_9GAMM|nr:hypothetical protein PTE_01728 [Photorhabdus khanii NC19]
MKAILWIFVLIIAPFVIAKVDQWRKRGIGDTWAWWKSENMPPELRSATLFLSEQDVSTTLPVPMHGRVDQVYQTIHPFWSGKTFLFLWRKVSHVKVFG